MSTDKLSKAALDYHRQAPAGKLEVVATKPMSNRHDLSLAYSPGVAAACAEIIKDPQQSYNLTARGNVVAVISNGTAVLGLGNIGATASKPVMEGKAVLFKRFAGINGIDIEVDETDVDRFCDIVAALEPSFGGINLEDIKAPECFEIERRLTQRMNIPVFHDDQHGTAIIAAAGLMNASELVNKSISDMRIVCNGAGAAGISILNMFCSIGAKKENILLCDSKGVVQRQRQDLNAQKLAYVVDTDKRTLSEALVGADVFIGVSVEGAMTEAMLASMGDDPIVFALANPNPEITPEVAKKVREDVIIATGRSDYPNQINNVLCFPFLFRGALDIGASTINDAMKIACAKAIASLAKKEVDESTSLAYNDNEQSLLFSRENLIPKPFDNRLIEEIAPAVVQAAMESGVATRPMDSVYAYKNRLRQFVNRSSIIIQNVLQPENPVNKAELPHLVFAEGEDEKVLNAAQMLINDRIAKPILVGRRRVIETYAKRYALRLNIDVDAIVVDPESDARYRDYHEALHQIGARDGITPNLARTLMRTNNAVIASMLLVREDYDAMVCGVTGTFQSCLKYAKIIVGIRHDISDAVAVNVVMPKNQPIFVADTRVSANPDPSRLVEIAKLAAEIVELFGIEPKIGMISSSNFGEFNVGIGSKMRQATARFKQQYPLIAIEGEMTPEAALDELLRQQLLPNNDLDGTANLLVMPNLDTAVIAYRLARATMHDGFTIGPIFAGFKRPVSILSRVDKARNIYNAAVVAIRQSQANKQRYKQVNLSL